MLNNGSVAPPAPMPARVSGGLRRAGKWARSKMLYFEPAKPRVAREARRQGFAPTYYFYLY